MANLPTGPHKIEELLRYSLDLGKKILEAHGAFFPFGAIVDGDGNVRPVGAAKMENPKTPEVYRVIENGMRNQYFKGEIEAGAIVADVNIPPELKPDHPSGIRVVVESHNASRIVFLPYKKLAVANRPEGEEGSPQYEYGELLGINVKPTIFVMPQE